MSGILSSLKTWFRNATRKKKFNYDYNSVFYKYADLSLYEELCAGAKEQTSVKNIHLCFNEIRFFITPKDLKKVLKKPVSIIELSQNPNIEVYLYKKIEDNEKQKILFHFFNDQLVIISRVFPYASNHKINELQNLQRVEHGLEKSDETKNKICFKDEKDQSLLLMKDVEYTEHFISSSPAFKKFIQSKFEEDSI